MRRPQIETRTSTASEMLQRLAVLLEAGITPMRAWEHLAASDAVAGSVVERVIQGTSLPSAIAAGEGTWREVAIAWEVASTVGAPLAPSLRAFGEALREEQESREDVRVALAEPAATARLVAWLPLVAVALAVALGFDVTRVLGNPLGIAALIAGLALMLAARQWTMRLVRAAQPAPGIPGVHAELLAIALSSGVSIARAESVVADAGGAADDRDSTAILALSSTAGAPAVELLRADAAGQRHRARIVGRLGAARLSSRLLIPLGVCTLPAFLLLGVAPMMLSVLGATSLTL